MNLYPCFPYFLVDLSKFDVECHCIMTLSSCECCVNESSESPILLEGVNQMLPYLVHCKTIWKELRTRALLSWLRECEFDENRTWGRK